MHTKTEISAETETETESFRSLEKIDFFYRHLGVYGGGG